MSDSKYHCKCGYCGIEWVDEELYSWRSDNRKCPHCAEAKNLKVLPLPTEGRDVFGYRFSPAVVPKTLSSAVYKLK